MRNPSPPAEHLMLTARECRPRDRAEASSLYVFSYYMGSSILGAATGRAFEALPWAGFMGVLALLLAVLTAIAVWLALRERR